MGQGHTVFVISWVNPDERLAGKTMSDYLLEGPVAALEAVGQATGETRVNAIGYCLGGTLLAATLAYLNAADAADSSPPEHAAKSGDAGKPPESATDAEETQAVESGDSGETRREPGAAESVESSAETASAAAVQESEAPSTAGRRPSIESATFFTTMVDFAEPGELGVFIDEEQLALVEESMQDKGYFDGAKMAEAFNLLRANDLIWSFVINNYLMGKDPFPFDLLYWNSDSTRMPRAMHSAYLRDMYQDNRLREPGGISLDGVPIDLSSIDAPVYILSTREDHIAPWKLHLRGDEASTAGRSVSSSPCPDTSPVVVNPPSANKYGYFTGEVAETPDRMARGGHRPRRLVVAGLGRLGERARAAARRRRASRAPGH